MTPVWLLWALALVGQPAWAGACCVGSTTTVPTRVGPCEHAVVAVGSALERSIGRWDGTARSRGSSLTETAAVANLGVGVGLSRRLQLGASLPLRWTQHTTPSLATSGGGVGDLRVTGTWLAVDEAFPTPGERSSLGVAATVGVRAPTGRSWAGSDDPLLSDVTGLPRPALVTGVQVERTMGARPWFAGVQADWGAPTRAIGAAVTGYGGVGQNLGSRWSALAQLSHTATLTQGDAGWAHAARTTVGARLVRGQPMRWRAWLAVDTDLPVPGLGRDQLQLTRFGAGAAFVR